MAEFYDPISPEEAAIVNGLARLLIELRESRLRLLARHGVEDEEALLAGIRAGAVPEHPAYEDYLGARAIAAARESIRADLKDYLPQVRLP